MLTTGIGWERLPQQHLGHGAGMTCWRRLRDWNDVGVFGQLHQLLLAKLHQAASSTGLARSSTSPTSGRSKGEAMGARPVDRGRAGSKHHLIYDIYDANEVPLAVRLAGGNAHDVTQLPPMEGIRRCRASVVGRCANPQMLLADRGYDFDQYRRALRSRESARRSPSVGSCTAPRLAGSVE